MKRRTRKRSMPTMILWDRRQQQRFVEAVERFVSMVRDLEVLLAAKKRRSASAFKAHETRKAHGNGVVNVEQLGADQAGEEGGQT